MHLLGEYVWAVPRSCCVTDRDHMGLLIVTVPILHTCPMGDKKLHDRKHAVPEIHHRYRRALVGLRIDVVINAVS